jgi:sec-independent protein translocase protein TatA
MLSSVLLFLNIGTPELILIMFVALLLFGGEKLPGLARSLGKGIRDFKDASEGVKREINNQINSYEEKKPADVVTPHTEVTETEKAAETKPLLDTSPVAGTVAYGESHSASDAQHVADPHLAQGYTAENHTTDTHVHTPAEPVKTTHE